MATRSSIRAWMGEPGRLQSMGSQESTMTERLHFHFLFHDSPPPLTIGPPDA